MNLLDAAYHVVHDYPGGPDSLAPRMNKSATTLCHEVTATGTAKLGVLTAETVTQLSGDLRILQAFAGNCDQMVVPLPRDFDVKSDDCMLRLAEAAKEFGTLCQEVAGDLADNSISDNELARIDRECGLLIARIHSMRESLAQKNQAGKPQHITRA